MRRARKTTRLIVLILLGVGPVVGGFVLIFVSTVPDARELDQEVFTGNVPPGPHVVPVNRTDISGTAFAWVEITGEILPCGLSMHALTAVQVDIFNETRVFPQGGIDCDHPTALIQAAATHIVALNQDLDDTYSYRVGPRTSR